MAIKKSELYSSLWAGADVSQYKDYYSAVMYVVDALQYFKDKSQEEIKKIAYDIAMLGRQGFFPDKEGYEVASMPNKTFSGYHILAYYYVSWALALPEMLQELQLPFDKEYEMAKMMKG